MKITLVSGTNRPGSNTRIVTTFIEGLYAKAGQPVEILDLAELPQEIFLPSSYEETPPAFQRFKDQVLASDGVHIVTPEYNGGVPGVLKYFIDMLEFPESFEHRPVAFTGLAAGMWGALRPVEQLQAIFAYRNAFVYPGRVFMPRINDLLTEEGAIKDEKIVEHLRGQVSGFVDFVKKLKG